MHVCGRSYIILLNHKFCLSAKCMDTCFGGDGVRTSCCAGVKNFGASLEPNFSSVFVRSVRIFSECSKMALIVATLSKFCDGV